MTDPAEGGARMEGILTFAQFAAVNRQRCESPHGFNHQLSSWSTSDWFTAIVGEIGEAANVAKKLNRIRDGIPGNKETEAALRDKLRKELGDTFVYLDLFAQALGFNIGDAAVEVFNAKSDEIGCPIRLASAAGSESALAGQAASSQEPLDFHGAGTAYWEQDEGCVVATIEASAQGATRDEAVRNVIRFVRSSWPPPEDWCERKVQPASAPGDPRRLREALEQIRDGDDSCRCNHDPETCCNNTVGVFCSFCIAEAALASPSSSPPAAARREQE